MVLQEIIETFKEIVIQIATPYSTGTGFYFAEQNLIVTNEHVVRKNRDVIIGGESFDKQIVPVLFVDEKHDLAFIGAPEKHQMPSINLVAEIDQKEGDKVLAVGHPFGLKYTATQGILSNTHHQQDDIRYYQHDAALNPGNSGGPLIDYLGKIIGVNTFIIQNGHNIGFSLPVNYLKEALDSYSKVEGQVAARCYSCSNIVSSKTSEGDYCPNCGVKLILPSQEEPYNPVGVKKTIEALLKELGYQVQLSRRGPNNWEVSRGSAKIRISYHEESGLILGDAALALLPRERIKDVYTFLLRENYLIEALTFSIKGQEIILSLLIFDQYLNVDTGIKMFKHLFEKADHYDDILVEKFNATWKESH